ncbi:hypothetical protein [Micrococcus porci]|uniref:hypothetical protein n=1 Tax=Micrococcus porci TaxID=2856555 RepID=UPI003CF92946
MLSEKSRPVIEATAAVVSANMPQITLAFYGHMFEAHPELLDGTFSRANQLNGEQAQALAVSIVHFAAHLLEHPDVSVRVTVADGLRQARQYSLSESASSTGQRVITVKLDEAGVPAPRIRYEIFGPHLWIAAA